MNRTTWLVLVLALLVISGVIAGQQAFSQQEPNLPPYEVEDESDSASLQHDVPTPIPAATPGDDFFETGSPMPDPDQEPDATITVPTTEAVPEAPTSGPELASDTIIASYTFDDEAALDGWAFTQSQNDPVAAQDWFILESELVAPDNSRAMYPFVDPIALPPDTLDGDGAVEVSALTRGAAERVGLLIGYQDEQNYIALILGTEDSLVYSGLSLIQMIDGEPTILAQDASLLIEPDSWYRLRLETEGDTVRALIDDLQVAEATLDTPLTGNQVGTYAGSEGFAYFDNLRILGN
jgi:hypothetical protein